MKLDPKIHQLSYAQLKLIVKKFGKKAVIKAILNMKEGQ